MILKNLSRKTFLTTDLKICTSLSDLSLGLLNPKNPRSLLFKTRFGLQTFGLKKTIDVLVLQTSRHAELVSASRAESRAEGEIPKQVRDDKGGEPIIFKVVVIQENLKPHCLFFWNPSFNTVVELPAGKVKSSRTQIGDRLELT